MTSFPPDLGDSSEAREQHHGALAKALTTLRAQVAQGGSAEARARQQARGKLMPRERIEALLDAGSPFVEIGALAACGLYDDDLPSAGIVAGIGQISNRLCMIVANDSTVKGGTYFPLTIKKHLRAQAVALENKLTCVYLVDSGGIHLPDQAEVFADREHFGRIFYNQAQMSAQNIVQIAVVVGMCTAGGAYVPAMSDENIMVRKQGTIYLAGPPLVEAATGEVATHEELGGADMHGSVSGVADHVVDTEHEALNKARTLIANLGPAEPPSFEPQQSRPPARPASELYRLLPVSRKTPLPMMALLECLLDADSFDCFKPNFGETLCCGYARWLGYSVGIVANQGVLFGDSADKGAHFVSLCARRKIPIIFIQNITGFMVGTQAERGGIAKQGAKMVQAVACAGVPKITLIVGASNGAGNYAMCGRAFGGRFVFSWPQARTGVMGADQAAQTLATLRAQKLRRQGKEVNAAAEAALAAPIRAQYEAQSEAVFGSARLWDDGILLMEETRDVIGLCLAAAAQAPLESGPAPLFRH